MASMNPALPTFTDASGTVQPTVTGNAQTSEVDRVSISTGVARGLIVPFIADLYVDASGTVGTLEEVSVTMTGIDQIFNVTLSEADSVKILNSFVVEDLSGGYGVSPLAKIQVSMKGETDFEAGLVAALNGTTVSTKSSVTDLKKYLKDESRKDTVDILSYDGLANLLEASDLLTYDIVIDASNGASNMYDAMNASTLTGARYRQAIFKQIPQANVETYITPADVSGITMNLEEVASLAFLPLLKGDKMTFVFDVAVGEYAWDNEMPSTGAHIDSKINDAANSGWSAAAYSSANLPAGTVGGVATINETPVQGTYSGEKLVFTTPSKRRVAITVQFGSGGGAFSLSEPLTISNAPTLVASS